MDNTITITPSGIAIGSPLVAGTQLSVTATGMEVAEDAALFLIVTSRFPDLLVASCPLSETTTEGEYAGTLYTATKQMSLFLVNARADEARSASIELVDTAHGASLARTTVPIYNSSLIPQPCRWPSASPLYVPGPAASVLVGTTTTLPPGSPATVENVGTTSDAVLNFGIPKGPAGPQVNPSDDNPLADGAASPGMSDAYARGDHRHPTDTSRMEASATGVDIIVQPSGQWGGTSIATFANIITERVNEKQDTITDLATIRSGAAAGATAVQPSALATVATTGDYDDLTNKPTIPPAQIQSDWNQTNAEAVDFIKNKPTIPGPAPSPSTATPQMDGVGAPGVATTYARGDHQHPSDTAKVNKAGDTMSGALTAYGFIAKQSFTVNPASGVFTTLEHPGILTVTETSGGAASVAFLPGTTAAAANPWKTIALGSDLRYSFASPTPTVSVTSATVACEDRAINDFTVATGITSLTITPPAAVTGRARDFFCRVTLTDSSLPTVTLSGGTIDIGASEVAGMTQGVNLLMFTEIASGHWLASRRSAS